MVLTFQKITEIPLSPFVFGGMSPLCEPCSLSGAAVEKTFVLPQLQLVEKLPPVVQTAENCWFSAVAVHQGRSHSCRGAEADPHGPLSMEIPQLQFDKVSSCRSAR